MSGLLPNTPPTLAGFTDFVTNYMQIPTGALASGSIYLQYAFGVSLATVNPAMMWVPGGLYTLMVYNLAGDNLINFAEDLPGQTVFTDLRTKYKVNSFVAGVVQSTGDEGTNVSLLVPDFFKTLTLNDLQNLKTPWGLTYLRMAQSYGPGAWGVS